MIGLLAVSIGILFLLAIGIYYTGGLPEMPAAERLPALMKAIVSVVLALPLLFLAAFIGRQGLSPWIWPAALFLITAHAIGAGASTVIEAGIDLKTLASVDAIGLKRLAASILGSKDLILLAYFARALAWILLGVALKPVARTATSVRPFRTLCVLSGLSLASVVGSPLFALLMPLSYVALGWFLIANRLGLHDDRRLRYIDDYRPA